MLQKIIYIIFILSTFSLYSYGIHISEYNETNVILTINSHLSELRAGQEKLTNAFVKDLDIQLLRADIQLIRVEQERQENVILAVESEIKRQNKSIVDKEVDNESLRADIQVLKTDIQSVRGELESQKKHILQKEATIQSLRTDNQVFRADIQSLRTELDNLKIEKESAIQSLKSDIQVLRTELKQQKKCVIDKEADVQKFRADIQSLRAELEQQKKLDKEADVQSLRADLEKQNKDVLQKESNIQSLRGEVERLGKLVEGLVKETDKHRSWFDPHNCSEAKFSGIHDILVPKFSNQTFKVFCDAETREGGWTIILRRMDGSVNFTRNWAEYKKGFGNLDGEYFLGLDKIHAMTAERPQELLIILEDFEGDERFETYDDFAIGDESQQYKLHTLGKANGTARDSLDYHRGMKFSTFDKDNDNWSGNCAIYCTGGWWYYKCQFSQLTGTYKDNRGEKGVNWETFRGWEYSLKTAIMMIRPKK